MPLFCCFPLTGPFVSSNVPFVPYNDVFVPCLFYLVQSGKLNLCDLKYLLISLYSMYVYFQSFSEE